MRNMKKFENFENDTEGEEQLGYERATINNEVKPTNQQTNKLTEEQLYERLSFIHEDAETLYELLKESNVDMDFESGDAPILTFISNILIASDIDDREPEEENWKLSKK